MPAGIFAITIFSIIDYGAGPFKNDDRVEPHESTGYHGRMSDWEGVKGPR
jgi:hypothetical protein